ncbi:MAG TPA: ankyrin repeat domain-containing protein [Verrucomicrobiota bacterium]|nr:ankyrin repeat domain-containing protein [Verrucomicrobiota bacterium]
MRTNQQHLGLALALGLVLAGCDGEKGDIHAAAYAGDLAKVKQLVAGGADINKRDKKKVTPLHLAAFQGNTRHIAMAKWMLANGANTGARDHDGKTPLNVATERGNNEIADVIRAGRTGGGGRQLIDGGVGVSEVLDF